MNVNPKKVEILLLEGNPFGLRYADIKNRTCRGLACNRASFKELLKRPELKKAGVYFLFGDSDIDKSGLPDIYIGEADILLERLPSHLDKDFWTEVIVFIAQDESLDKASVRYLESVLVQRALQDKQANLYNVNNPTIKNLSESNIAVMNEFVDDIIFLLVVLGYPLLRPFFSYEANDLPKLFINKDGISACGRETDEGFLIYKDSIIRGRVTPSYGKSETKLRQTLINKGVILNNVFAQDYVVRSPSLAAGIILGRSSNGRIEWKTKEGKTLKFLQEEMLKKL